MADDTTSDPVGAVADDGASTEEGFPQVTFWPVEVPVRSVAGLEEAGLTRAEAPEVADLIILSTRVSRGRVVQVLAMLPDGPTRLVLAHPGGEQIASDMVKGGARAVIAEGNEPGVAAYARVRRGRTAAASEMVDLYLRRVRATDGAGTAFEGDTDTVQGLPGPGSLTAAVVEAADGDLSMRAWSLNVAGLGARMRELTPAAGAVLRRRLVVSLKQAVTSVGGVLYATEPDQYVVLARAGRSDQGARLAELLVSAVAGFSQSSTAPLDVVIGHAGPENASDTRAVLELADRTRQFAGALGGTAVRAAEDISRNLASSTELDVIAAMLAEASPGSERAAQLAGAVAGALDLADTDAVTCQLLAYLSPLGLTLLPGELAGVDQATAEQAGQLESWRTWPALLSDWLRSVAGEAAADAVSSVCEQWDGSGFPAGAAGYDIPLTARVARCALDVTSLRDGGADAAAVVAWVQERAGTAFDPVVVAACVQVVQASTVS
jgi:hypothetical protein